jgi:4-aminobutyrate aminotransferase-like enzyme
MTTTEQTVTTAQPSGSAAHEAELQKKAKDHLWMHFSRQSVMEDGGGVPIITKGEGHHIWDSKGKKYIDGLSGLFVVNAGQTGGGARVFSDLVVCAPRRDRTG